MVVDSFLFTKSVFTRSCPFKLFVVLAVACMFGCSTIEMPEVAVKPVEQYSIFQEQNGLKIAIEPFFDRKIITAIFGYDMLSENILPVFMVIENSNEKANFILKKEDFRIGPSGILGNSIEPSKLVKEQLDAEQAAKNLVGIPVVATVGSAILGSLLIVESYSLIHKIETYKHNILRKELMEKNLYPGSSQSGFVYFKFKTLDKETAILVQALNFQDTSTLTFKFLARKRE